MFTTNKEGLIHYIVEKLNEDCKTENSLKNYRNFGTAVEQYLSKHIQDYLIANEGYDQGDFVEALSKNDFPDLYILKGKYAVEFKSASDDSGPANDMGTLNEWLNKIDTYGNNIYYVFLEYSKQKDHILIENCYIEKVYWFIGVRGGEDEILKYRKKDGNLRPKTWEDFHNLVVYWADIDDFKEAIEATISYRAKEMVIQYLELLNQEQLLDVLEIIKAKIKKD
jgi:hypothetical protein